jgi:hypothetical protein
MSADHTIDSPDPVPLDFGQRTRLVVDCLPVPGIVALVAAYHVFVAPLVGSGPPAFYIVALIALALTGNTAYGRLRDLQSGVALVIQDRLEKVRRSRGPRGEMYGTFDRLGRIRLTSLAFRESRTGAVHRVVYSPASRIVWSAEPLGTTRRRSQS